MGERKELKEGDMGGKERWEVIEEKRRAGEEVRMEGEG